MLDYFKTRRRILMGSGVSIDPILENNDWETIAQIAKAGLAQKYWNIGDTKTLLIDGETHKAQIVAFDQYDVTDSSAYGRSKAGIVFQTKGLLERIFPMNEEEDNSGGYAYMTGRSVIQDLVVLSEVGHLAIEVQIPCSGYSNSKLLPLKGFLPSEYEVFGTKTHEKVAMGTRYAFYANGGETRKYRYHTTSYGYDWWLRSAPSGYTNTWVIVSANGNLSTDYVDQSMKNRVAPCFCL